MKKRNPIAKAVRMIKPKVVPDKRKEIKSQLQIDELRKHAGECVAKYQSEVE